MKKQVQDPDRQAIVMLPTFASLMGHKSSLVDTCKSSMFFAINRYCKQSNIIITHLHNNTLAHGTVTNDDIGLHEYSC